MWTEKYRPTRLDEILGNEEAKAKTVQWLKNWKLGKNPLLLYGNPGTGKTTLVHVLAKQFNYSLIELNTSDRRTEAKINEIAGRATQNTSLEELFKQKKGTIIFFDEVDGIYGREDYGGVAAITKIIQGASAPIILAANDISDEKISAIVTASKAIQLYGVRLPLLVAFLKHVCKQEGVRAEDEAIKLIATNSQGDVRSALNDLQAYSRNKVLKAKEIMNIFGRTKIISLQDTLTQLLKTTNMKEARKILDASQTPIYRDEVLLTIHDNLPLIYKGQLQQLAKAYQTLSDADMILKRIKNTTRSNWHLIPYLIEILTLLFINNPPDNTSLTLSYPPQKIILMGRTKKTRFIRNQIATKIKARCHLSNRTATTEVTPYLRLVMKSNTQIATQLQKWLNLTDEEVAYLEKS